MLCAVFWNDKQKIKFIHYRYGAKRSTFGLFTPMDYKHTLRVMQHAKKSNAFKQNNYFVRESSFYKLYTL